MGQQKQKNRKIGRTKKKGHSVRYRNERRREKSHLRRIDRHLKRYDTNKRDLVAQEARTRFKIASY